MSRAGTDQPEKPGRYNRSTGGLIGSMIVLVVVVLGIVVFRGASARPRSTSPPTSTTSS